MSNSSINIARNEVRPRLAFRLGACEGYMLTWLLVRIAELVTMNETFVKARAMFDRMMEDSLARHSACVYFDHQYLIVCLSFP